jgi:hypothetical protein
LDNPYIAPRLNLFNLFTFFRVADDKRIAEYGNISLLRHNLTGENRRFSFVISGHFIGFYRDRQS